MGALGTSLDEIGVVPPRSRDRLSAIVLDPLTKPLRSLAKSNFASTLVQSPSEEIGFITGTTVGSATHYRTLQDYNIGIFVRLCVFCLSSTSEDTEDMRDVPIRP